MRLNLTFVLQLINFAISYWFLNKFMFKPVLAFLKKRDEKERRLQKDIEKKENNLLDLEHIKQEELVEFKEKVKTKYRIIPFIQPEVATQIPCKVDKKTAKKLIDIAKDILVQKVPHVD